MAACPPVSNGPEPVRTEACYENLELQDPSRYLCVCKLQIEVKKRGEQNSMPTKTITETR